MPCRHRAPGVAVVADEKGSMKLYAVACGARYWICANGTEHAMASLFEHWLATGVATIDELAEDDTQLSLFTDEGESMTPTQAATLAGTGHVLASSAEPIARPRARLVRLSERMFDLLVAIMNDACADDPKDIDCRQLRNIIRQAKVDRLRKTARVSEAVPELAAARAR